MRIVMPGATGFLGRLVLARLTGHDVIAVARTPPPGDAQFLPHVTWLQADLTRALDLSRLPVQADALLHLAQSPRYGDFPGGAEDVFQVNVAASAALLGWAARAGVSRAMFASTGTVYEPYDALLAEDQPVAPTSNYGASKYACEVLSRPYTTLFPVAQARLFFLYGPHQKAMLVPRLISSIRNGQPVTLPKNGDGFRLVPTFGDDAARVLVQGLDEAWSGIWNVASPHSVSLRQLFETIGTAVGRAPVITRNDQSSAPVIVPDLTKLATRVDMSAFTPLDEGLRRAIAASG